MDGIEVYLLQFDDNSSFSVVVMFYLDVTAVALALRKILEMVLIFEFLLA